VCMARLNVYLPDDLASEVKAVELNVSAVLQRALRAELASRATATWLEGLAALPTVDVPDEAVERALDAAREDAARAADGAVDG
jgi:post-segregation antitoxin (ccd killing protein)